MFRRLRNRFLIINMTLITFVMLAAFTAVYFASYNSNMESMRNRLDSSTTVTYSTVGPVSVHGTVSDEVEPLPANPIWIQQATEDGMSHAIRDVESGKEYEVKIIDNKIYTLDGVRILPYNEISNSAEDTINDIHVNVKPTLTSGVFAFTLITDENRDLVSGLSEIDISENIYSQAASHIRQNDINYSVVSIDNREWMYYTTTYDGVLNVSVNDKVAVSATEPGVRYVSNFIDITESKDTLMLMLTDLATVGVIMLFVIFGISYFFAERSIKPIAEAWDKQKRFVEDASHELKTPIAIIGANMDALEISGEQEGGLQPWLEYIRHELNRMGKLAGDLLYLARAEDIRDKAKTAGTAALPLSLSNLCDEAAALSEAMIYERGIDFIQSIEEGITVKADAEKLRRVLLILLDNAVKYTEEGGKITFTLRRHRGGAVIQVRNSGEGIPANDIPHIFDRFYRADRSRSRSGAKDEGGYGLGLAIAKAAVERDRGTITVHSGGNDTVFTIQFPMNK